MCNMKALSLLVKTSWPLRLKFLFKHHTRAVGLQHKLVVFVMSDSLQTYFGRHLEYEAMGARVTVVRLGV